MNMNCKKFIQKVNNELIGFSVNTIQMDDVLEIVERYAKITDRMKLMRDLKRYLFPDQPSIESMDANAYQPCHGGAAAASSYSGGKR